MSTPPLFDCSGIHLLEDVTLSHIIRAGRASGAVRVQVRPNSHAEAKLKRLFGQHLEMVAPGMCEIHFAPSDLALGSE